jgi:MOSC domain-containing protein YiiM
MNPIVLQVNTSSGGVPKRAVDEAMVTVEGLEGDDWNHPNIHGGKTQAVLVITVEGIEELIALGYPLYPGALGENLTTRGLDRRGVRIGQRYRAGRAVLEITKLRLPCSTIDVYGAGIQAAMFDTRTMAGDVTSPKWGLSGFYAAVIEPGVVRAGDAIESVGG